jgi:hypothetical protein
VTIAAIEICRVVTIQLVMADLVDQDVAGFVYALPVVCEEVPVTGAV